ncbi:hypothetical protein Z043_103836, partial [Scleropages formosus]
LTESQADSSYYSPQKVKSREVLCLEQEGITIEGIMGVKDFEENMNRSEEDALFFCCGETLSSKGNTYLTNSLFDYRSPENNGVRAEFILDAIHHKVQMVYASGTGSGPQQPCSGQA